MNDDLPSFEQFSDEIDEEMRAFAQYMMTRAVVDGGPTAKRYMIILATLSRGMSLVQFMLEQEGLSKSDIDLALIAMKATNEQIREGFEQLKRDMR